jgi:integrase
MVESEIKKRVTQWGETACATMTPSSKKRYVWALEQFLTAYPKASTVLVKPSLDREDIITLGNMISEWIFVKHKQPLYVTAYAVFLFIKFYYNRAFVDDLKDLMRFKQKNSPHSNRIVRDYKKITEIIRGVEEPCDVMARLEWETGCRAGALFKMKFNINLNDPKNFLIIKAIKENIFNKDILGKNQDFFWKRDDGFCFVLLEEKRGKILERIITDELYDWLVGWKQQRLKTIRDLLDKHYNFSKKLKYLKFMNNTLFPMSHWNYNHLLKKVAFRLGIQNFSSHYFRGTRATLLLEKGMNIRQIQTLLGHSNLSTTERYTPIDISNKEQLQDYLDILKNEVA